MEQEDPALAIRIVYDGPPETGKTTSVRALARSFGRDVYTPEEENGRTVFFDWLEHTGGRFDGAPIRCQIASVPGQARWLERRLYFLERADAVVFVGDTSAGRFGETLERLRDLRSRLDVRGGTPVGIVFQANRRDAPDAVPIAQVRERIGSDRIAVVESVAVDGSGVRETFVFAVRLALDRVREEQGSGSFGARLPHATSDEVLALFRPRAAVREAHANLAEPAASAAPAAEAPVAEVSRPLGNALPRAPGEDVPSGLVWPPVTGRILLREAARGSGIVVVTPDGHFQADLSDGWLAHSYAAAAYDDLDRGRSALIGWARLHASAQPLLSARRCIALVETGNGRYRLWQVVRREPSLRDLFGDGAEPEKAPSRTRLLAITSRLLTEAQAICTVASLPLSCTLDTVGVSDADHATYVGLVPPVSYPLAS